MVFVEPGTNSALRDLAMVSLEQETPELSGWNTHPCLPRSE